MTIICFGQQVTAVVSAAPQDQFWLGIARLVASGILATVVSLAGLVAAHRIGH